jgi:transcriptional regulator with XRE-family HTH domain
MASQDPDAFVMRVSRKIAESRRAAGLTQAEAAERFGTALNNWQRFEHGRNITLHTLARIANVLGVRCEELVGTGQAVGRSRGRGRTRKTG